MFHSAFMYYIFMVNFGATRQDTKLCFQETLIDVLLSFHELYFDYLSKHQESELCFQGTPTDVPFCFHVLYFHGKFWSYSSRY